MNKLNKIKLLISGPTIKEALRICGLSLGLLGLSACSVHKASFDCPNGKGMGCGSMIEVHKSIKDNSFASEVEERNQSKVKPVCLSCKKNNSMPVITQEMGHNLTPTHADMNTAASNASNNVVSRSQDQIMKIWFNSYFDEQNNYHDSQYIYTIIQPAQWLVSKREKS